MSATNVERFRQLIEAANRGDLEAALALIATDVVWIAARSAVQGPYHGHDGIRTFFADNQESFERFEPVIDEARDLGGNVLVIGSIHVRGRGSGVDTVVPMAGIATYRYGKLTRWEDFRERERALEAAALLE
ncbi:MAG: nuclear transport factor 2 family protein [Actinomycetota bacterium]|nr:nuclear transport factor 2 family protein [Actinomycetota bacterium]